MEGERPVPLDGDDERHRPVPAPAGPAPSGAPPCDAPGGTAPSDGPPRRPPAGRPGLAPAVVLAACLAVLVWHAGLGLRATRQLTWGWWHDQAAATEQQYTCLSRRLIDLVPSGSVVHVQSSAGEAWRQRVIELAAQRAQVAELVADADLTVSVDPAPPGVGCDGLTLRGVS